MKVYMKFDFYEDREELETTLNATKYKSVLLELDNKLRAETKYRDDEAAQKWRDTLYELLGEEGVSLW